MKRQVGFFITASACLLLAFLCSQPTGIPAAQTLIDQIPAPYVISVVDAKTNGFGGRKITYALGRMRPEDYAGLLDSIKNEGIEIRKSVSTWDLADALEAVGFSAKQIIDYRAFPFTSDHVTWRRVYEGRNYLFDFYYSPQKNTFFVFIISSRARLKRVFKLSDSQR